jgi:hypothetical protein
VGKFPRAITTKDLNHDTHLDLVTANAGSDDITILLGNGDGSFQSLEHIPVLTAPASIAVGHFDRDPSNHWDLAVANAGFDNVSVLLGDGQGGFISAPIK